jgi:hypothetical protein
MKEDEVKDFWLAVFVILTAVYLVLSHHAGL